MKNLINALKLILNGVFLFILCILLLKTFKFTKPNNSTMPTAHKDAAIAQFNLNTNEITYDDKQTTDTPDLTEETTSNNISKIKRADVLNKAKAMTEVKWIPKYDIKDNYGNYVFKKGKTYIGIPYTMDSYQVSSVNDFLSKINGSKKIYGNDCSAFVSTAWGLSRQTTYTFYSAAKSANKLDGNRIFQISWNDIKPGDALLKDNGKGKGHIVLYIATDADNSDKLYVYEQNIQTTVPPSPFPVARKDVRSKATLIKEGYIPIRLDGLN